MTSERQQSLSPQEGKPSEVIHPSEQEVEAFVAKVTAQQRLEFNTPGLSATFNFNEGEKTCFKSALISCERDEDGGSRITIWDGDVGPEGLTVTDCTRAVVLERKPGIEGVVITERTVRNPLEGEVTLDSALRIAGLGEAINDESQYSRRELSAQDFSAAYGDLFHQSMQPLWRGSVVTA